MPIHSHFDNIQAEIIKTLASSEKQVKAAVAWLTDTTIISVLNNLLNRQVHIEIIINDDDINKRRAYELEQLAKHGAKVFYYPAELGLMHHKFCVVDDSILIMGSYNWTYSAANKNQESIIITENEVDAVTHFCKEFDLLKEKMGVVDTGTLVLHSDSVRLKTEILFLETDIGLLETEKADLEKTILEFEISLKKEVGYLILERLTLDKQLHELKAALTQKQDDVAVFEEKQKVVADFEKSWQAAKEKKSVNLNVVDEKEMKNLYRESMMMAHPDRFINDPEKQKEANAIAAALSEAYKNKDIDKIKEIWQHLKDGLAFKSDWLNNNDEAYLEKLLSHLLAKKQLLSQEINLLKEHSVWEIIKNYADYNAYFEEMKKTLEINISILKNEIKKYL